MKYSFTPTSQNTIEGQPVIPSKNILKCFDTLKGTHHKMKSCNGNYITTLHYKWYSYLLDNQETIPYTSYKEFPTSERSATKANKYM
jgi:hypothetical protein